MPAVGLGEVAEVVDGAALLAPGELRDADRPAQPAVPVRVPGQYEQVLACGSGAPARSMPGWGSIQATPAPKIVPSMIPV